MGMVDSKDYENSIKRIVDISDNIFFIDDFAQNAVSVKKLKEIYRENTQACKSFAEAFENAKNLALENNGIVVICGSLYLASEYLNNYYNLE